MPLNGLTAGIETSRQNLIIEAFLKKLRERTLLKNGVLVISADNNFLVLPDTALNETMFKRVEADYTRNGHTDVPFRELVSPGSERMQPIKDGLVAFGSGFLNGLKVEKELLTNTIKFNRENQGIIICYSLALIYEGTNQDYGAVIVSLEKQALVVQEGILGFVDLDLNPSDVEELQKEVNLLNNEVQLLRNQNADLVQQNKNYSTTVAQLSQENLNLKAQIQQMIEQSKRTPEQFATAVSNSVDNLQTHLSQMTNEVSNFVVREFDLQAKVYVDVTTEGKIDYRFILPGDNVDSQKVSNLSLKLVPIPKPQPDASGESPALSGNRSLTTAAASKLSAQSYDIREIYGIGEHYARQLNDEKVYTTVDLLAQTRMRSVAELSALLGVQRQELANWIIQAQLLVLKGMNGHLAHLFTQLGINSLQQLSQSDPDDLLTRLNSAISSQHLKILEAIRLEQVQDWIHQAQAVQTQ